MAEDGFGGGMLDDIHVWVEKQNAWILIAAISQSPFHRTCVEIFVHIFG